jgi:hypothetical protein
MKKIYLALIFTLSLEADLYHYQNLSQGDMSTALGGAYTALSMDNAGMYNNPAGYIESIDSVSASIQAYHYSDFTYENANTETGEDYTRNTQGVLPSLFSYTLENEVWGGKLGLSMLTEQNMNVDQHENSKYLNDHSEISLQQKYTVLNAGLTYSRAVSDKLSWGISLYGIKKDNQYINKQFVDWRLQQNYTNSYYVNDTQYGVKPIVGVLYRINDNHRVGLSLKKDIIFHREYNNVYSYFDGNQSIYEEYNSDEVPETPYILSLGYAYKDDKKVISFDIKHHTAESKRTYKNGTVIRHDLTTDTYDNSDYKVAINDADTNVREVTNFSLGGSYKFDNKHAIHIGLFTDYSKIDKGVVKSGQYFASEYVDLFGGVLSYSFPISEKEATIGLLYSQGKGEADIAYMNFNTEGGDYTANVSQKNIMAFVNVKL